MGKILHLSDFHFGINKTLEEQKLKALATFLKDKDVEYLVFTGDIVDAKVLTRACRVKMEKLYPKNYKEDGRKKESQEVFEKRVVEAGKEHIKAYNDYLEMHYKRAMIDAKQRINNFINEVGTITRRNIVFCCGNHDRLRLLSENTEIFPCVNNKIDEKVFAYDYKFYDEFCNDMSFSFNHHTATYCTKDINFLIVNSNWRTPLNKESNNMCISCKNVADMLYDLRSEDNFECKRNILIAHKPFDDFCENAKFSYNGKEFTIKEIIEISACAFLYGDKHSFDVKLRGPLKQFMCGAPISSENVHYNLIDYSCELGIESCQYIFWDRDKWILIPVHDCISEVYQKSKIYLKKQPLFCLSGEENVPSDWIAAMEIMQKAIENGRFDTLSDLFLACSRGYKGEREGLDLNENLFVIFTKLLLSSQEYRPISIKGEPGTGKSSFLMIEYIYLLREFWNGASKYMPFYFNFETLFENGQRDVEGTDKIEEIINKYYNCFVKFLNECLGVANKYNIPVCLLIDGMEQKNLLLLDSETLEYKVNKVLENSAVKSKGKYVMCFNTHQTPSFEKSFSKIDRFDYVFFMNDVDIIQYKSKNERYIKLIDAYLKLMQIDEELPRDVFLNKILKLRRISINLKFLIENHKEICGIDDRECSWDVMLAHKRTLEMRAEQLFDDEKASKIRRAAYLLYIRGECYQQIIQDTEINGCISYQNFLDIKDKPDISEYLIASYFVERLDFYSNKTIEISKDSILHCFITRNTAIMIRLILAEKNQKMLLDFLTNHKSELTGYLYSTVVYIVGHLKTSNVSRLIKKISMPPNTPAKGFFKNCEIRTYNFASVVSSKNRENALKEFRRLMTNESDRKFNRIYQLYYYGDIKNELGIEDAEKEMIIPFRKGFDFHNCFLILVAKLRANFAIKQPYPLMEIDLFTLCDFTYSRLQLSPTSELSREQMFFYGADYNRKGDSSSDNVLATIIELLDEYLKNSTIYAPEHDENMYVLAYFNYMKRRFTKIKDEHFKNQGKTVYKPYVAQAYDFKRILELENIRRVGWNIDHDGNVVKDELQAWHKTTECIKETMMQYIMETVYIAQLFLPEKLPNEGYSKYAVISLLLMSELGKINSKDYVPQSANNFIKRLKKCESECLSDFLMLGTVDGYADQHDILRKIDKNNRKIGTNTDINLTICREIQVIQMEYKYYSLYQELNFEPERRKDFEEDFTEPETSICKEIRRKLIKENPDFYDYLKSTSDSV